MIFAKCEGRVTPLPLQQCVDEICGANENGKLADTAPDATSEKATGGMDRLGNPDVHTKVKVGGTRVGRTTR